MNTIELSTRLDASPDLVWECVNTPRLLQYVAAGWLKFLPIDPPAFPERWEDREYRLALRAFGLLPLGWQIVGIERPRAEDGRRILRDNGRSPLLRCWDHRIIVEADPAGGTRYSDRVSIEAGILTVPITVFARGFFAHRQRRLRGLVTQGLEAFLSADRQRPTRSA